MSPKALRSVLVVALTVLAAAFSPAAQAQSCDDIANHWIAENVGEVPTSYRELSAIPLVYRRAAFRQLDATTRSQMWTSQLQGYLTANPQLIAPQRALIHEALRLVGPDLYSSSGQPSAALDGKLKSLHERAVKAFGQDNARRIFGELGPVDVDLVKLMPNASREKLLIEAAPPTCSCADASSYCSSSNHCDYGGCKTASGCGTLWRYTCDGMCKSKTTSISSSVN